jgi:hypothetical protein
MLLLFQLGDIGLIGNYVGSNRLIKNIQHDDIIMNMAATSLLHIRRVYAFTYCSDPLAASH